MAAKRTSVLRRSKQAENRVVRYLAGPEAKRDWKDEHDITVEDADGNVWTGEVKNYAWPTGPGGLWKIMDKAFEQASGYSNRSFACYLPTNSELRFALVASRVGGEVAVTTLEQFRARLGLTPAEDIDDGGLL